MNENVKAAHAAHQEKDVDLKNKPHTQDAPTNELLAHGRRTATVARLIAHHLFLPPEEMSLLLPACLLRHHIAAAGAENMETLANIFWEDAPVVHDQNPGQVRKILDAYDALMAGRHAT